MYAWQLKEFDHRVCISGKVIKKMRECGVSTFCIFFVFTFLLPIYYSIMTQMLDRYDMLVVSDIKACAINVGLFL